MAWDDEPLYYRNQPLAKPEKNVVPISPKIPWANNVRMAPSQGYSQLALWWMEESRKKKLGLVNEIDVAEIIAASKGVKNAWSIRWRLNPIQFKSIFEKGKVNWEEITQPIIEKAQVANE